jgi:hypothetical protein
LSEKERGETERKTGRQRQTDCKKKVIACERERERERESRRKRKIVDLRHV